MKPWFINYESDMKSSCALFPVPLFEWFSFFLFISNSSAINRFSKLLGMLLAIIFPSDLSRDISFIALWGSTIGQKTNDFNRNKFLNSLKFLGRILRSLAFANSPKVDGSWLAAIVLFDFASKSPMIFQIFEISSPTKNVIEKGHYWVHLYSYLYLSRKLIWLCEFYFHVHWA